MRPLRIPLLALFATLALAVVLPAAASADDHKKRKRAFEEKLDADPDRAMTDVLSKLAQVKSILPREANDSIVTKKTGEGYALMYLSFNSDVMNSSQISDYLQRVVQPRLQTLEGVAQAQMLGGQVFSMRIWLDPDRMAALGVTPLDVRTALADNNFTSAPGQVKGDFIQRTSLEGHSF